MKVISADAKEVIVVDEALSDIAALFSATNHQRLEWRYLNVAVRMA
jgi:hypothetical protein